MKFCTENDLSPDGKLLLVSKNGELCVDASDIAPDLLTAIQNWQDTAPDLQARYEQLNRGELENVRELEPLSLKAPMPRSWQWLDGSLFMSHGLLMQKAFNLEPIADADRYPLVYQGAGDNFSGPRDIIVTPESNLGVDFEGEFGVITDKVEMGACAEQALEAVRLVVLLNDISYRALAPREMKTGFGFVQAKGATAFAPIAVTPDELGDHWQNGKVELPLTIHRNGEWFGAPSGKEMHFGFHELIAHVAKTRHIQPGTVFGSGTVSNSDPGVGQACIAELRAKELVSSGQPITPFLAPGESVYMESINSDQQSVFGAINQRVGGTQ